MGKRTSIEDKRLGGLGLGGLAASVLEEPPAADNWIAPDPNSLNGAIDGLEVLDLIGQGSMGAVYRARQTELGRDVAVKILPPELSRDPELVERFKREAKAAAALRSPGIVAIHDFGQTDKGQLYFVMEFVEGADLRSILIDGPLPAQQAAAIVTDLCDALEHAHAAGLVHRDIKPSNILINSDGAAILGDFGIVASLNLDSNDPSLTRSQHALGTRNYMAPEQLRGAAASPAADVYALGVVLFESLTGELPHSQPAALGDTRQNQLVRQMLKQEPEARPSLRQIRHWLNSKPFPRRILWSTVVGAFAVAAAIVLFKNPNGSNEREQKIQSSIQSEANLDNFAGVRDGELLIQRHGDSFEIIQVSAEDDVIVVVEMRSGKPPTRVPIESAESLRVTSHGDVRLGDLSAFDGDISVESQRIQVQSRAVLRATESNSIRLSAGLQLHVSPKASIETVNGDINLDANFGMGSHEFAGLTIDGGYIATHQGGIFIIGKLGPQSQKPEAVSIVGTAIIESTGTKNPGRIEIRGYVPPQGAPIPTNAVRIDDSLVRSAAAGMFIRGSNESPMNGKGLVLENSARVLSDSGTVEIGGGSRSLESFLMSGDCLVESTNGALQIGAGGKGGKPALRIQGLDGDAPQISGSNVNIRANHAAVRNARIHAKSSLEFLPGFNASLELICEQNSESEAIPLRIFGNPTMKFEQSVLTLAEPQNWAAESVLVRFKSAEEPRISPFLNLANDATPIGDSKLKLQFIDNDIRLVSQQLPTPEPTEPINHQPRKRTPQHPQRRRDCRRPRNPRRRRIPLHHRSRPLPRD